MAYSFSISVADGWGPMPPFLVTEPSPVSSNCIPYPELMFGNMFHCGIEGTTTQFHPVSSVTCLGRNDWCSQTFQQQTGRETYKEHPAVYESDQYCLGERQFELKCDPGLQSSDIKSEYTELDVNKKTDHVQLNSWQK